MGMAYRSQFEDTTELIKFMEMVQAQGRYHIVPVKVTLSPWTAAERERRGNPPRCGVAVACASLWDDDMAASFGRWHDALRGR